MRPLASLQVPRNPAPSYAAWPLCAAVAATLVMTAPSPAQPAPVPPQPAAATPQLSDHEALDPAIERLIADLASASYAERQQATESLRARADVTLNLLDHLLTRPGLTPEQRVRLHAIARDRFATTPRGAMGVAFGGVLRQSRVVIGATYDGFDSHTQLKPGDMIIAADGRPLRGDLAQFTLRAIVFAHDPGDTLPLTVRRGEQKLELSLKLGSFRTLEETANSRPLDELDFARAWAMRCSLFPHGRRADEPEAPAPPEPIVTTLPAAEWPSAREQLQHRYKLANARLYGESGGPVTVAAGGQMRPESALDPAYTFGSQPAHPLEALTRAPNMMERERELALLIMNEARIEEELRAQTARLDSPDLPRREQTEEVVEQLRQGLEIIRLERAAIEAEHRELGDEEIDLEGLESILLEQ